MKLKFMVFFTAALLLFSGCSQEAPSYPADEDLFVISFQEEVLPSAGYNSTYCAHINSTNPNNRYADCLQNTIGISGGTNRLAVYFDVTAIPSQAVVVKAYLKLTTQLLVSGLNFTAYRQFTYWWDGSGGCGTAGATFDARWNGPWSTPGGDLTTAVGTASSSDARTINFELNTAMVQDWVEKGINSGTDGNFGVIIKENNESSGYLTVNSDDATVTSFRPVLTVYYKLP